MKNFLMALAVATSSLSGCTVVLLIWSLYLSQVESFGIFGLAFAFFSFVTVLLARILE